MSKNSIDTSPQKSQPGTQLKTIPVKEIKSVGYVSSIETLGALDGPGLRSVVFLQGCSLSCKYCHNPECITPKLGRTYTAQELCLELLKYSSYWGNSAGLEPGNATGGVTFSGGEPLLQADFILQVAKQLARIHHAVDTSLFVPQFHIEQLLKRIDYWMVSVKHLDTQAHKFLTGQGNKHILRNLDYLDGQLAAANKFKSLRLRYLVIPGYTDSTSYAAGFVRLALSLKSLDSIELLAYNSHAKAKWEMASKTFSFGGIPDATRDQLELLAGQLRAAGLKVIY
jgi:pyruvate formate lyase activating enzyme